MNIKILHVIEGVDKKLGGQPAALFGILKLENLLNVESEVLSIEPPANSFDKNNFTQKFHLFPKTSPKRFLNSEEGIGWLKDNVKRFDLVVLHGLWNLLIYRSAVTAAENNVKYIIWPHGSLVPYDLKKKATLKSILGKTFIQNVLKKADCLCLTSTKEREVVNTFGVDINKAILPLPVGIPPLSKALPPLSPDQNFTFVFIGRIDYKKGLDISIKAFIEVVKEFPDIKFDIWGTGDKNYTQYIQDLIKKNNIGDKVALKGFLEFNDKRKVYNTSQCFMLTSIYENFGIAPIEALQGGLPVLISNNIYIWEDIKEAAWICEYDVASVIEQMKIVLTDKPLYDQKKKISIEVGDQYAEQNLVQSYREFYSTYVSE